jgi:small-conductance mechanosensitive channel
MLEETLEGFRDLQQWWQIGILGGILLAAVWIGRGARQLAAQHFVVTAPFSVAGFADAGLRTLAVPLFVGIASLIAHWFLARNVLPRQVLYATAVLALSLVAVRAVMQLLKLAWRQGPLIALFAKLVSWLIWALLALYLLGWLGDATRTLDSIIVPLGKSSFSLLAAGRVILIMLAFLIVAGYLGLLLEKRMMRVTEVSVGIRVGIVKFARFFLIVIAVAIALNTIGVDLTALTIFGGALGVGLGFGLQRIASNFISGFILVADRSISQGDVISIGSRFGVVRELRARYVVVRDRDGVDTLIPNENIITSEVINWSYADRNVRLKLPVQVSYTDNPRQAMELLLGAARDHSRVEKSPAPAARVIAFGENGIELELRFWIRDPEDGVNNVRSDLYLAIWDAFETAGITIPFPQRDLHLRGDWPSMKA